MSEKRHNPYNALRDECREWAAKVVSPHRTTMWMYKTEQLTPDRSWRLDVLAERVRAADQIGYDVRLRPTAEGLVVEYVKRAPLPPWKIRP